MISPMPVWLLASEGDQKSVPAALENDTRTLGGLLILTRGRTAAKKKRGFLQMAFMPEEKKCSPSQSGKRGGAIWEY